MHRMPRVKRRWSFAASVVGFALASMISTKADARGLMIVNTGEDVIKIADLDAEILRELEIEGNPAVGVMYSRFGLFWLDIVRWNPQYVMYRDEGRDGFSYGELSEEDLTVLAELTGLDTIKKPLRYYLPPGGVLLGLLIVVGGPLAARSAMADNKRRATLMADPRYAAAVHRYETDLDTPVTERFEQAVAQLVEQGVPEEQGRPNLWYLCGLEEA
jgi:hypothetical protein